MTSEVNNNNNSGYVAINMPAEVKLNLNDKDRHSRLYYMAKLGQTILLRPITTTVAAAFHIAKLFTWVPLKAGSFKFSGHDMESKAYLEREYLTTVKAIRDTVFIPSVAIQVFKDMVGKREEYLDDMPRTQTQDYLNVPYTKSFPLFSSYMHGCKAFETIHPEIIQEFKAANDPDLNTVMASHFLKPGRMAINFGAPNVAAFVIEKGEDGKVQTTKVDAKSLYREKMEFRPSNGKIQSGIFLVPTNLPKEALDRFKEAAKNMEGSKNITCVNTNCRVLEAAGFSIEGVAMDGVVFPTTLMDHLLNRKVFYTDKATNTKHRVHFDIINTTKQNIEEFVAGVDMAVVGTRYRHDRRKDDTPEAKEARELEAKRVIAAEKKIIDDLTPEEMSRGDDSGYREVTISVPSVIGDTCADFWGRHTVFGMDLSDKKDVIADAFQKIVKDGEEMLLKPFPQEKPSLATRLKRDIFFSKRSICFLRKHMMASADTIHLKTRDIFDHLKSTNGARLNYALVGDKMFITRVHANGDSDQLIRKVADWALSKHALAANRADVYVSGEMWYDADKKRFMMNQDSGTYKPTFEHVKVLADLANEILDAKRFGVEFEAVTAEVA